MNFRVLRLISFSIFLLLAFTRCEPEVRTRAYGTLHLGKIVDLMQPEILMLERGFILRHDANGFYVMSTFCTHDLTGLVIKETPAGKILASNFSDSTYDLKGKVLTGPAKGNLPYYKIELGNSVYGGPNDSLYAKVGEEVPVTYRFQVKAIE